MGSSRKRHLQPAKLPWATCAIILPFLLLYWANIAHHTLFFDEINAWSISTSSPTLAKLFFYVHYEGHPWLWYFILWFPSRLTHDPVALKWVEAVFGTANILLIGLLTPFTSKQRALILASYFMVWEYTVMCRMYSVMLLLVLLYLVLRERRPHAVLACFLLLGLAGNTDMTGVLLSSALLIEYTWIGWLSLPAPERRAAWKPWVIGWVTYAALIALAVATLWPSKDISWETPGHMGSQALHAARIASSVLDMIAGPWWPVSPEFPHRFWRVDPIRAHRFYLLAAAVLFAYWRTFRRHPRSLLLMGCTLLFGIVFADVIYPGSPRHWGIAFVSFVAALWMQSHTRSDGDRPSAPWTLSAYALLALSAVAGTVTIISSWHRPFSRARETAQWIEANVPPGTLITGAPDVNFASMGEEMQRPMYFLECQCVDTFKLFSKERNTFDASEIPARLNVALDQQHRHDLIFVTFRLLNADDDARFAAAHLKVTELQAFTGADMINETYFVYAVTREAS